MLKNYFKVSWRNITGHKWYTIINVLGLALGISSCIVIFLVTSFEFSFDRFHPGGERIFRIVGDIRQSTGEKEFMASPHDDLAGVQTQIPGFEATAGFHRYDGGVSIPDGKNPPKKFDNRIEGSYSAATIITWPAYFDIFTYQWLQGNPKTALSTPFQVVLTEKRARKYFGDIPLQTMIGKRVIYEDSLLVSVSGIVKDWTGNSDLGYTDFISISTATHSFLKNRIPTEDWTSLRPHGSMAFVKLSKGTTALQVNRQFAAYIKDHIKENGHGATLNMYLQPLTDIHFTKDFRRGDDGDNFRKAYMPALYALMGIALFILIIAVVNFINLSTAQSVQRAKEIGVRKVLGSNKTKIIFQFLSETLVITVFAVLLSVSLIDPILHLFGDYIPEGIQFRLLDLQVVTFLLFITTITTILSGFYPGKVLASYLPVLSLKGNAAQLRNEKFSLRKALIVFQFTFSLVFIIGSLVIGNQIHYMNNADKGFNPDAVITINNWGDREGKTGVFAEAIKHIPGIARVIMQGNPPMGFAQSMDNYNYKPAGDNIIQVSAQIGNSEFIPFYRMKLVAGRNMLAGDSLREVVINETFSKTLGFKSPQDALGKTLYQEGYQSEKPYPIVGVVADFHEGSFQEAIRPAVIENVPERKFSVAIRLTANEKSPGEVRSVLDQIEHQWKKIFPGSSFDYSFLDESISWLYGQEEKTAWLTYVAMAITIFISCMGIFGLGMFTAQRRTKEIGIRKVLGASVTDIATMLSRDFIKLVFIAILVASPLAWYLMNRWLQDYAYRITINWWIFMVAGLSAIFIALFTVSFQAIKAAIANPVKSLRNE